MRIAVTYENGQIFQHFSFLYIVNLKCLCVSKVLENLSIFICYCYSHDTFSFFYCIFLINLMFVTSSKAAVAALTVTDYEIPTLNFKRMSINESICYFLSGNLVNPLDRCSCDLHRFCTLLLTVPFSVSSNVFESAREKELVFVHKTIYDGEILPSDELDGGRFWTIEEIKENLGKGIFTPNFEGEIDKVLSLK